MRTTALVTLTAIALPAALAAAQAQIRLTYCSQYTAAFASAVNADGSPFYVIDQDRQPYSSHPYSWQGGSSVTIPNLEAVANYRSDFPDSAIGTQMAFAGDTSAQAAVDPLLHQSLAVEAFAYVEGTMTFTLSTTGLRVDGLLSSFGAGRAFLEITRADTVLGYWSTDDGFSALDELLTVEPGGSVYRFRMAAEVVDSTALQGGFESGSAFDMRFTAVPTPASLALLAAAAPFARRRRG